MLDHFIAKNATAHKVNSYYTLAISYCTFCVGKHTILGPGLMTLTCNTNHALVKTAINAPVEQAKTSAQCRHTMRRSAQLYTVLCNPNPDL